MEVLNLNISPESVAILTFFGIGLATLVHNAFKKDFETVAKILICSIGTGLVALLVPGVTAVAGAAIGLSASGVLTSFSFLGKGQTPAVVTAPDIEPVQELA